MKTTLSPNELKARGYTVDTHCKPSIAYKGPRFKPTEILEIHEDPSTRHLGPEDVVVYRDGDRDLIVEIQELEPQEDGKNLCLCTCDTHGNDYRTIGYFTAETLAEVALKLIGVSMKNSVDKGALVTSVVSALNIRILKDDGQR